MNKNNFLTYNIAESYEKQVWPTPLNRTKIDCNSVHIILFLLCICDIHFTIPVCIISDDKKPDNFIVVSKLNQKRGTYAVFKFIFRDLNLRSKRIQESSIICLLP